MSRPPRARPGMVCPNCNQPATYTPTSQMHLWRCNLCGGGVRVHRTVHPRTPKRHQHRGSTPRQLPSVG
jgi:ribosomal protein L37AE/L43A